MTTLRVNISDAAIKRALATPGVSILADPRFPLRLKINKARTQGTYWLIEYSKGGQPWHKLGKWPAIPAKQIIEGLPERLIGLSQGQKPIYDQWLTVAELLTWFKERTLKNGNLSQERRTGIKSSVNKHLIPRLGCLSIHDINRHEIDELLFLPLSFKYSLHTFSYHLKVLKAAFNLAYRFELINRNPMAKHVFGSFTKADLSPKDAALRSDHLPALFAELIQYQDKEYLLCLIMLCLGTRIGETRRLKWRYFDADLSRLNIPKELTKTNKALTLPLSPWLADHLHQFKASTPNQSAWLFTQAGKPISKQTASDWVMFVSAGDYQAHDLRKVARTTWTEIGIDFLIAEQLLNHAVTKMVSTYVSAEQDQQKRLAIEHYHQHLLSVATKLPPRSQQFVNHQSSQIGQGLKAFRYSAPQGSIENESS